MSTEFKLPELGENIESGDVVNVLVSEGDQIEGNQGVVELETDKAVVEIPCPHAGKVTKINVKKGDTVKVGETVLEIEPSDGEPAEEEGAEPKAEPEREPKPEKEEKAEPKKPERAEQPSAAEEPSEREEPTPPGEGPIPAGPAARRIAREMGVDLSRVRGSGARGRITPEDVQAAAQARREAPREERPPAKKEPVVSLEPVTPPGEPDQDKWGQIRVERMSKIRRTIAAQMSLSAGTIPHVTNFDDADVTDLEHFRKGVPRGFLGSGVKLTAMPFVMKAVAVALRRHPMLNATLDEESQQIIYKEYVHLGVAVDTPRGLVVPKVRNVDRMSIAEIARALVSLAERARAVQFSVDELRGGTFTLSNLGAVGGTYSTPIINHPEVAILLLGRTRWVAVMRDGKMEPRQLMPLSLSYDHRLVDGATAARFLNEVIDHLQSPARLLLAE